MSSNAESWKHCNIVYTHLVQSCSWGWRPTSSKKPQTPTCVALYVGTHLFKMFTRYSRMSASTKSWRNFCTKYHLFRSLRLVAHIFKTKDNKFLASFFRDMLQQDILTIFKAVRWLQVEIHFFKLRIHLPLNSKPGKAASSLAPKAVHCKSIKLVPGSCGSPHLHSHGFCARCAENSN